MFLGFGCSSSDVDARSPIAAPLLLQIVSTAFRPAHNRLLSSWAPVPHGQTLCVTGAPVETSLVVVILFNNKGS